MDGIQSFKCVESDINAAVAASERLRAEIAVLLNKQAGLPRLVLATSADLGVVCPRH